MANDTLSPGAFEMLRVAVNTARNWQCRTLKSLKDRLALEWPDRSADIDEALVYWANNVRERHPDGVPRT